MSMIGGALCYHGNDNHICKIIVLGFNQIVQHYNIHYTPFEMQYK